MALARGKEGEGSASLWAKHRSEHVCYADAQHPFRLQGSADLNSYKMFTEVFWRLLRHDGRLGVILPTGIYSDFGTKDLREELLHRGRLDFLYAFQNEKRIFSAAHHALQAGRCTCDQRRQHAVVPHPLSHGRWRLSRGPRDSRRHPASRRSGDVVHARRRPAQQPEDAEPRRTREPRDLDVFRKIYAHSIRIGDNAPGWEITYSREFDMTNDSKHFPAAGQVGGDGLQAGRVRSLDRARWRSLPCRSTRADDRPVRSLLIKRGFSGKGRTAVWRDDAVR